MSDIIMDFSEYLSNLTNILSLISNNYPNQPIWYSGYVEVWDNTLYCKK